MMGQLEYNQSLRAPDPEWEEEVPAKPGRKYREFRIAAGINVSSTGHWWLTVSMSVWNRSGYRVGYERGTWGPGFDFLYDRDRELQLPRYAIAAIECALLDLLKSGHAAFYEYNQDKVKRYENLRYITEDDKVWMIGVLEKNCPKDAANDH